MRSSANLREFASSLRNSPGFPRLLSVRLTSQLADGVFQASLLGGVLFNPERHSDPLAAALGFAVLLVPYSVIGPFAGALLDHWDRRSVLLWANVLRAVLIAVVALAIDAGRGDTTVLISALAVTGASRFVASGLSASLPHVAHPEVIVATNSLVTTLGGAMLSVGALVALGARSIVGSDNTGSAETMIIAVIFALASAAIAHRFPRRLLGPDEPDDAGRSAVHAVSVGFVHGARAVAQCRPAAAALSAIGVHRLVFGANTLLLLVFLRDAGDGDGLGRISVALGFVAVGGFFAAITTPIAVARWGRRTTLMVALLIGAGAQALLFTFSMPVYWVAALIVGLVGQTAKLCGDVAMQVDIGDTVRGQVFSVQDAVFNVAYVVAMIVAALVVPADGRSGVLIALGVVCYLAGVVVVRVVHPEHQAAAPTALVAGQRPNSGASSR